MKIKKLYSLLMLIVLASCQNNNSPTDPHNNAAVDKNIIATFNGDSLSKNELNEYLTTLPTNSRWNTQDTQQWLTDIIKNLANQKQLIGQAKALKAEESPLYQYKAHELKRYLYSQQYLIKSDASLNTSEQELLDYYQANIDAYTVDEERMVYHLFKAKADDAKQALIAITALRQRLLNGENFKLLAEKYSDSESRHLQGLIGKIKRGVMTADFDKIIFSLNRNVPSEVVSTAEGYHIFYISDILPSKTFEFSEVKKIIQQKLSDEKKLAILKAQSENLIAAELLYLPNSEAELLNQVESGGAAAMVLKIGDYQLNVSQLKYSINAIKLARPAIKVKEIAYSWLMETAYREMIYQYMLENAIAFEHEAVLKVQTDELLVKEFSQIKILEYVNAHPELVQDYYDKNAKRFSSAIKFSFEKLSIPKIDNQNLMADLESSVALLNAGQMDLDNLASKYPGTITEIRLKTLAQLAELDQNIVSFASELSPNQHSYPYTTRTDYHLVKLTERIEPQVQPLSMIRDQVLKKYIETNETQLFSQVLQQLEKSITINDNNLADFIEEFSNYY